MESKKVQLDDLEPAIPKLDDSLVEVQDPLQEINLGDKNKHKPTFISQLLEPKFQTELIELLREYRDCFIWDYDEMPGLSRELVEHRLPIKEGCRSFKQQPRRTSPIVTLKDRKSVV